MRRIVRNLLLLTALIVLAGCTIPKPPTYEEGTRHYQTIERFQSIAILVQAGVGMNLAPEEFRNLHEQVAAEMTEYLARYGISALEGGRAGVARLELTISVPLVGKRIVRRSNAPLTAEDKRRVMAQLFHSTGYQIAARLLDADGNLINEVTLGHRAGHSGAKATAQQLASLIADDMLLIWYPPPAVVGEAWFKPKPAPFSVLQSPVDKNAPHLRLEWESFPSQRILEGTGLAMTDINDVSYELRLMPVKKFMSLANSRYTPSNRVYRARRLTAPEHVLPFVMPVCEATSWSVRAHFKLKGHPRMTEWSGEYSTRLGYKFMNFHLPITPPYIGRLTERNFVFGVHPLQHHIGGGVPFELDPPEPLNCKDLKPNRERQVSRMELPPLSSDESIAVIALTSEACVGSECVERAGAAEASEKLAACLVNEFNRHDLDLPVYDMMKLLSELPVRLGSDDELLDKSTLYDHLRAPKNRQYLEARGIRYLVSTGMSLEVVGASTYIEGGILLGGVESSVRYRSSMESEIIDLVAGNIVGTVNSAAEGTKGAAVPMFVIIPFAYIPYGSRARIEKKACDALARRVSFALRGGVSGWPDEYFQDAYAPLWKHD